MKEANRAAVRPAELVADLLRRGEIGIEFAHASGPGGQNVNKVSTAVRLRLDIAGSRLLPWEIRDRLLHLAGARRTKGGVLLIEARRFRSQEKNRQDALRRLESLIERASLKPRERVSTVPGRGAVEKRLRNKRRRGQLKRERDKPAELEE